MFSTSHFGLPIGTLEAFAGHIWPQKCILCISKILSFLTFFDLIFVIIAAYFFIPESNRIELDLCMQVFVVRECVGKVCVLKTNLGKLRY